MSEAVNLRPRDLFLDGDRPTLKVRQGKGHRDRIVPVHPELKGALESALAFWDLSRDAPLLGVHRSTIWGWLRNAYRAAVEAGKIRDGLRMFPHILRHSAARHWLSEGVPINVVSRWLGHANLSTTLVYLEILPDPEGFMERVG